MKRLGALGGAIVLAMLSVGAGVAGATATLDKTSVPGNTNVDLVLQMSVEELVGYNQKIVMSVPEGFQVLACTAPAGYTCSKAAASNPTRTVVTWNNTTPAPNEFGLTPTVRFPFRLHTTPTTGDYKFDVVQTYSNGSTTEWKGAKGTPNAAPVLNVAGQGAPAVTNTTVPDNSTPTTSDTTTPSSPSFDFGSPTNTTVNFGDLSTPTTSGAATATTVADGSTDTTVNGLAAEIVSSSSGDKGIHGAEKVVLLGLAVLAVGSAAFASLRQRNA